LHLTLLKLSRPSDCSKSWINWDAWKEHYAPTGALMPWVGPPGTDLQAALEWCSASASFVLAKTDKIMTNESQQIWAAWMGNTTFTFTAHNRWEFELFCNVSGLKSGDLCRAGLRRIGWILNESCLLHLSVTRGRSCESRIDGALLTMDRHAHIGGALDPGTVAPFMLSLARRGLTCSGAGQEDCSIRTCGFEQVEKGPCTYSDVFLERNGRLTAAARPYVTQKYMACVAQQVSQCMAISVDVTKWRDTINDILPFFLLLGNLWLLLVRASHRYHLQLPRLILDTSARMRSCLASRVVLGLLVAWVIGVIVARYELALFTENITALPASLNPYTSAVCYWVILSGIIGQILLHTLVVGMNIRAHLRLREKFFALPVNVVFGDGEELPPDDWDGPDLRAFTEMARSSLLFAQYFPGIVFWHLFINAWIFVVIVLCIVTVFLLVCAPQEQRLNAATYLWNHLNYLIVVAVTLLSHYFQRIFLVRCMLVEDALYGLRLRRPCLFSVYEIFNLLISFSLGYYAAIRDFFNGWLSVVLASLLVAKPNFSQFGELCDYVYCSYCACLYLERVEEEHRRRSEQHIADTAIWNSGGPLRRMETPHRAGATEKMKCIGQFLIFLLLFCAVPYVASVLVNFWGQRMGYGCVDFVWPVLDTCWL